MCLCPCVKLWFVECWQCVVQGACDGGHWQQPLCSWGWLPSASRRAQAWQATLIVPGWSLLRLAAAYLMHTRCSPPGIEPTYTRNPKLWQINVTWWCSDCWYHTFGIGELIVARMPVWRLAILAPVDWQRASTTRHTTCLSITSGLHGLTWIPAGISIHLPSKMWDEIIHSHQVWEWDKHDE